MIFFGVAVVSTVGMVLTSQTSPVVLTQQTENPVSSEEESASNQNYDNSQLVAAVTATPTPTPTPAPAPTVYKNSSQTATGYCPSGNLKTNVTKTYTVSDGSITSTVSKADADIKAMTSAKSTADALLASSGVCRYLNWGCMEKLADFNSCPVGTVKTSRYLSGEFILIPDNTYEAGSQVAADAMCQDMLRRQLIASVCETK